MYALKKYKTYQPEKKLLNNSGNSAYNIHLSHILPNKSNLPPSSPLKCETYNKATEHLLTGPLLNTHNFKIHAPYFSKAHFGVCMIQLNLLINSVQKSEHWKIVVSTHLNKTLYRIIANEETPYFYMFSTFILLHSRDTQMATIINME